MKKNMITAKIVLFFRLLVMPAGLVLFFLGFRIPGFLIWGIALLIYIVSGQFYVKGQVVDTLLTIALAILGACSFLYLQPISNLVKNHLHVLPRKR